MRSPELGLVGEGMRYVIAGGTVGCVYIATTLLLSAGFGTGFQVALAVGFGTALVVHFNLQRLFVWTHHGEFALPVHQQLSRYLPLALLQYATTAAATEFIPKAVGLATVVVYLTVVAIWVASNFVVFRYRIFHEGRGPSN